MEINKFTNRYSRFQQVVSFTLIIVTEELRYSEKCQRAQTIRLAAHRPMILMTRSRSIVLLFSNRFCLDKAGGRTHSWAQFGGGHGGRGPPTF